MIRRFAAVMLMLGTAVGAPDWIDQLSPDTAGTAPPLRPFEAEYRFGWTDLEAARAKVQVERGQDAYSVRGTGGTEGLARMLWQMDFEHTASSSAPDFRLIEARQVERYRNRKIVTRMETRPDGFWRIREAGPDARWKRIKVSPIRDLFSTMLFLRSQTLGVGDSVTTVAYPGDSPFLATVTVRSTQTLNIAGREWDALVMDLTLRRINLKKDMALEPHGRFQSGRIWLSNDPDRIPLRAEVNIFIGYVFGELVTISFPEAG
ncbi:MAG: DUF3108 domain-containing protein [Terrimicrobiaceae bacterium]|nr:DUF3108 domain-containing protein [Terrimicrobiaceae bacterium]